MLNSVFDLFKIGIGPSSSHSVAPMRAARLFAQALQNDAMLAQVASVKCELYGSLGATGKGHGSDVAVMVGLMGHAPDTVNVEAVPLLIAPARQTQSLLLPGRQPVTSGDELLATCKTHHLRVSDVMWANDRTWRSDEAIRAGLLNIWRVMRECVQRGLRYEGTLPGPFWVERRARLLALSTNSTRPSLAPKWAWPTPWRLRAWRR